MSRTLGWIAAIGLTVGGVSLSLAWAIGGRDVRQMLAEEGRFPLGSCDDSTVTVGGSERRLPWTGDDTLDIALPTALRLIASDRNDVVLRGAPEAIAHLQLSGRRLYADCRRLTASQPIEVELPARALRHVRLSGATRVTLEKLNQPDLTLKVSGSGEVRAQGAVDRATVEVSGSGDIRLGDVALKRLVVKMSGSGNLEAAPKDEADIHLSGSANVRLLSRPASLHSKVSGSGRISQAPVEAADKK
jgi:Putative auto-transporter adhesin, head GIN domain